MYIKTKHGWMEAEVCQGNYTRYPELCTAKPRKFCLRTASRFAVGVSMFRVHRDLTAIDWTETPLLHCQIQQLAIADFMECAHSLILVAGTGTEKTHLATALGVAAIYSLLPYKSAAWRFSLDDTI